MNETTPFTRKPLSASAYVLALHSPEDRVAVLVRNRARGQTMQRILAAETIASPLFLYWLNEQNESGADIFLGMNPIKDHCHTRVKESIARFVMCISTSMSGQATLFKPFEPRATCLQPNFVLDTSPEKHQVIWKVEGLNQEQAESLLRCLATAFRGDLAATDVSRVLRLPGFANQKYNERFLVRAIQESDQIHHLRDFAAYEDSPTRPAKSEMTPTRAKVAAWAPEPVRSRLGVCQTRTCSWRFT